MTENRCSISMPLLGNQLWIGSLPILAWYASVEETRPAKLLICYTALD